MLSTSLSILYCRSADKAIQQFGRSHRANQAHSPQYYLLFTPLGGERRFAAAVARRLESLGALTQGDRRAGPSLGSYNYESIWGQKALREMYAFILGEKPMPPGLTATFNSAGTDLDSSSNAAEAFLRRTRHELRNVGLLRVTTEAGSSEDGAPGNLSIDERDRSDVPRFLNRLLGFHPSWQSELFGFFQNIMDDFIERAKVEGTLGKCYHNSRMFVMYMTCTLSLCTPI